MSVYECNVDFSFFIICHIRDGNIDLQNKTKTFELLKRCLTIGKYLFECFWQDIVCNGCGVTSERVHVSICWISGLVSSPFLGLILKWDPYAQCIRYKQIGVKTFSIRRDPSCPHTTSSHATLKMADIVL